MICVVRGERVSLYTNNRSWDGDESVLPYILIFLDDHRSLVFYSNFIPLKSSYTFFINGKWEMGKND